MKPNLCFPLRFYVKSIALLDFLVSSMGVVVAGGSLIAIHLFTSEISSWIKNGDGSEEIEQIQSGLSYFINLQKAWMEDGGIFASAILILGLIYMLQKLVLASLLIIAVYQERLKLLRIWVVYTLIVLVFSVLGFLLLLTFGVLEPLCIPFFVISFISREYVLWLVYSFLQRIRTLKGFTRDPYLLPTSLPGPSKTYQPREIGEEVVQRL